jgi:8-oxo-dGTP diphosphatase
MFRRLKHLPKYKGRSLWRLLSGSKWVAAGALIFDDQGRVLLIRHRWRSSWEYPVGMSDGTESPLDAARREISEEVGLHPGHFRLLAVDFFHRRSPNGNLVFSFAATVSPVEAARLKLDPFEATDSRWATRAEALDLVPDWLHDRLKALFTAYDAGQCFYLEDGQAIPDQA